MARPPSRPLGLTRALILFALFALTFAAPAVPAQEPQWHEVGRARLGDPASDAPYQVTLWSDVEPAPAFVPGDMPRFLLGVADRRNGTNLAPGPDLRVYVYRCAPTEGITQCDEPVRAATEVGARVVDDADGATDGRYVFAPPEATPFAEGTWHLVASLADEPVENVATFALEVREPAPGPEWLGQALRYLFGLEGNGLTRVAVFLLWVTLFVLLTRYATRFARRTVLSPRRVDPTIGRLAGRLIGTGIFVVGFAFALWVTFRINFWAGLTALGLLSVALGFGMQNTVANIMGGVSLALDKPFVIGDRIQVGDTWGDVEEVGLRSTRILTTKREYVIIPNKLLDEREIWNYTRSHQELRIDIDVGISYDSDRRLAEALLMQAARENKDVLAYPRPRVLLMEFGPHGIILQLRCWLRHAKDARFVSSDLRKATKDKFDDNGVEIPFPYRTIVHKSDLPKPRHAEAVELDGYRMRQEGLPRMLYATGGPEPLDTVAGLVAHVAAELDMALVLACVAAPDISPARAASINYRINSAFEVAATHRNVPLRTIERQGEVLATVESLVKSENIDLLVIGSAHHHPLYLPMRELAVLTRRIRDVVGVPVLIIPRDLRVHDRALEHYRKIIEERVQRRQRPARIQPDENEEEGDVTDDDAARPDPVT